MHNFFSRSFYTFSQSLFKRPLYAYWVLYYLDVLVFVYCTPRLFFIYFVLDDQDNLAYYRLVDPGINFIASLDPFMAILIWLLDLFQFIAMTLSTRIDPKAAVWKFWYNVIVQLQDNYYQCTLNQTELVEVQKVSQKKLIKVLQQKLSLINCLKPVWVIKLIAKAGTPVIVLMQMKNIHQDQFYKQSLVGLPNLSNNCKRITTLFMIVIDWLFYCLQVIISKNLFLIFKTIFILVSSFICSDICLVLS